MKYIDVEKLISEIERRIEETKSMKPSFDKFWAGQISAFKGVITIIASLQQEQKAIDEEVRLKKCDDMTKAEYDREVAFADWYLKNGTGTPTFSDAIEWARKEVIEKACEWLDNYLMEIGYPDDWLRDSLNIKSGKERFKKAMEK